MQNVTQEANLPNGMKIFCLRKEEVPILYSQIQEYLKNGIELHEDDTVFDVGANIGLFTLWAYQLCNKKIHAYAFEPIPAVFEVLQANAQRFDPERIRVFPCGLSEKSGTFTFAYFPNATMLSTVYKADTQELREQIKQSALRNLNSLPTSARWIRWIPPILRSFILDSKLGKAFQVEQVTCQLRTISEIMSENEIERIDLLKVDVEKSELDVLLGIDQNDWGKIRQVAVEIHDLESRVDKIRELLKNQGFSQITINQENSLEGSNIFNLYALR